MVAFVSFDWFCGSVTGATFFRGNTIGYWSQSPVVLVESGLAPLVFP